MKIIEPERFSVKARSQPQHQGGDDPAEAGIANA